ncbi:hypothetical protein CLD22_06090 [Rubrivivax gelatinosus]|nr:hypothetical protein [Rubrivivax gelatinosus]
MPVKPRRRCGWRAPGRTTTMAAMDTTDLLLAPGQALTLPPGPAGRRLRVLQGRIWLTASGCADDEVLATGTEHVLPAGSRGALVVEALDGPVRAELLLPGAALNPGARSPGAVPRSPAWRPAPGR